MWRVTATDREGREVARVEIEVGDLSIGRDADRQLVLASPSVSRRHCRLRIDGSGPVVMDEGSANGVIVNGIRITGPTPVNQMSRIEVAEFRLSVEPVGPQARAPMSGGMGMMDPSQGQGMMPMAGGGSGMMPVSGMPGMGMGGAAMAPPMPADLVRLIAEGGPYDGRVFDLPPLQEMAVGRAVDNDLVLDDPSLSRKHARMRRLGGGRLEVEDVNSANGTYINGRKIGRAQLGPGDTLRFGELMFRVDGGGLVPQARPQTAGGEASAPPAVKRAFFALAGVTALVYVVVIVKLLTQAPAPPKGVIEEAISQQIHKADALVRSAQEEFDKHDWTKAKNYADKAIDIAPANIEAWRLKSQAIRAEDDESKRKQGLAEMDKGSMEGLDQALLIYHAMSSTSPNREDFAGKLTQKLYQAGTELYKSKKYRECANALCNAYQVAPANQKPGGALVKMMRDAERKARVTTPCPIK